MPDHKRRSNRVTIVDVAKESGFAPSTVSIVLNDAPVARRVPEQTKAHIKKTAKALGYRPDMIARSLRSRRSQTIGIMIFDISDPFCVMALTGIQRRFDSTEYLPIIMDARGDRKRFEAYLALLLERQVEGLIVVANWLMGDPKLFVGIKNNLPIVMIGRDLSKVGLHSITADNETGGHMSVRHLYELGHRKIAIIRGPKKMVNADQRWDGIERFLAERHLSINAKHIQQLPDSWDARTAFSCGENITELLLRSTPRFTALAAFDDLTALGAVRALSRAGISVPNDCSIIGFDDVPPAALSTPGLTTIRQPLEEIGILAADYVLKELREDRDDTPQSFRLQALSPSLVIRDSTQKYHR